MNIYLAVTALLGFLVLIIPEVVIIGLFLFVVPGLILAVMPSLFLYGVAVNIIKDDGPPFSKKKGSFFKAVCWVLAGSIVLGALLNVPTYAKIYTFLRADKDLAQPVRNPPSLAILTTPVKEFRGTLTPTACTYVCQRLLLERDAALVVIGTPDDLKNADKTHLPGYKNCKSADKSCIQPVENTLADVAFIMVIDREFNVPAEKFDTLFNPLADTVAATRIELYQNGVAGRQLLYRKTLLRAEPLLVPLGIGALSGYGFNFDSGFFRYPIAFNRPKAIWEGDSKVWRYAESLFDLAEVDGVNSDPLHRKKISVDAYEAILNAPEEGSTPSLFGAALEVNLPTSIGTGNEEGRELSARMEQLVARALADHRNVNVAFMRNSIRYGSDVYDAGVARIMSSPLPEQWAVVSALSSVLSNGDFGRHADSFERLKDIAQEPERRWLAWRAVYRIADAGEAAIPELKKWLDTAIAAQSTGQLAEDRDARTGLAALMGICTLEARKIPVPDIDEKLMLYESLAGATPMPATMAEAINPYLPDVTTKGRSTVSGTITTLTASILLHKYPELQLKYPERSMQYKPDFPAIFHSASPHLKEELTRISRIGIRQEWPVCQLPYKASPL